MKNLVWLLFIAINASSADCLAYRFVDIGDSYPSFCAKQRNGNRICSSVYDNTIMVISFFRLHQNHSQKMLRDLEKINLAFTNKNVTVLGIVSGEIDLQELDKLIRINNVTFPILLDPDRKIYGSFGVFVYPSTGVFSKDNRLQYYLPGRSVNAYKHLEGYIRFLLGEISSYDLDKMINPQVDKVSEEYKKSENYYNFARIYFKKGKLEKAKELLDLSISHYNKYALSYSLYGYIHIQEKQYQLGLEKFQLALRIDPDLQEAKAGKQICVDKLDSTDIQLLTR